MINLLFFGGMSECGKTYASKYCLSKGFEHVKIIFFEREVMKAFNIDPDSNDYNPFAKLYDREHDVVFESFLEVIKKYSDERNIKNIVLDSTTRKDMIEFLIKHNDINIISTYIETDFDKRVNREYEKLNKEKEYSIIEEQTRTKDKQKLSRNADKVKDCSLVITNNGSVESLNRKLDSIMFLIKNFDITQDKNTFHNNITNEIYRYYDEPIEISNKVNKELNEAPHFDE